MKLKALSCLWLVFSAGAVYAAGTPTGWDVQVKTQVATKGVPDYLYTIDASGTCRVSNWTGSGGAALNGSQASYENNNGSHNNNICRSLGIFVR